MDNRKRFEYSVNYAGKDALKGYSRQTHSPQIMMVKRFFVNENKIPEKIFTQAVNRTRLALRARSVARLVIVEGYTHVHAGRVVSPPMNRKLVHKHVKRVRAEIAKQAGCPAEHEVVSVCVPTAHKKQALKEIDIVLDKFQTNKQDGGVNA